MFYIDTLCVASPPRRLWLRLVGFDYVCISMPFCWVLILRVSLLISVTVQCGLGNTNCCSAINSSPLVAEVGRCHACMHLPRPHGLLSRVHHCYKHDQPRPNEPTLCLNSSVVVFRRMHNLGRSRPDLVGSHAQTAKDECDGPVLSYHTRRPAGSTPADRGGGLVERE